MKTILLIALLFTLASCRFGDNNSTLRAYIKAREPYLNDLKAKVESYDFDNDKLIANIFKQGYQAFVDSAIPYVQDNTKKEDVNAFIEKVFPKSLDGRSGSEQFIEGSFSYSGIFASIFSFVTPVGSKSARMFIYLGEKADLFDKVGDYMLIDYEKTIDLPEDYMSYNQQSFMDWCPGFVHVCMGSSTSGHDKESLTIEQSKWVYNFMGVVFYETLKKLYH